MKGFLMERVPERQNLITLFFLIIFTFGIYYVFWLYHTKEDINGIGGKIPTFLLFWIPILNIYFFYCFAYEFVRCIRKQEDRWVIVGHFLFALFFWFIFPFVIQYQINEYYCKQNWQC